MFGAHLLQTADRGMFHSPMIPAHKLGFSVYDKLQVIQRNVQTRRWCLEVNCDELLIQAI